MKKRKLGRFALLVAFLITLASCKKSTDVVKGISGETCVTDAEYFKRKIYGPIIQAKGCYGCHSATGVAKNSGVQWYLTQDNADADFATLKGVAQLKTGTEDTLLIKPQRPSTGGGITHAGGILLATGADDAYIADLTEFITRSRNPTNCSKAAVNYDVLYGVQEYDYADTLRRASIALTGNVPTLEHETLVEADGKQGLLAALDQIMNTNDFFERLREMMNDVFLTDEFYYNPDVGVTNNATDRLDNRFYPDKDWYTAFPATGYDSSVTSSAGTAANCPFSTNENAVYQNFLAGQTVADPLGCMRTHLSVMTNRSVGREPLELIIYIVKNNRPFSEIMTAPYMVVNPYSARVYGATEVPYIKDNDRWENFDYNAFVPVQLKQKEVVEEFAGGTWIETVRQNKINVPHAGLLTSPLFLTKYPTSTNNVNRHRSRMFFQYFLDTNVLTLAQQLDSFGDGEANPTYTNPACAVCHTVMDPVAGLFKNYQYGNYYRVEQWYHDSNWRRTNTNTRMRSPGMSEEKPMPGSSSNNALQWLGEQTVADKRFSLAMVKMMFKALTGRNTITRPTDNDRPPGMADADWNTRYEQLDQSYQLQSRDIETFRQNFISSGYNLKSLIKEIILSTYFRASNARSSVSSDPRISQVGISRLLSPEQLNRKIRSVTGYEWKPTIGRPYLLSRFRFLYGGIDSRNITTRTEQPNGLMSGIQMRMAMEVGCNAVTSDFTFLEHSRRKLLPLVEPSYVPEINGVANPTAIEKIKRNIQYLHKRLLGEYLPLNHAEIDRTYQFFYLTFKELSNPATVAGNHNSLKCTINYGTDIPDGRRSVTTDNDKTIRAWQATVSLLLSDFRFVFE